MVLVPATLGEDPSGRAPGVPWSPLYDDLYSTDAGAEAQARHVFMGGNGLPARWQGRHRFVILETGFGLGHNFLSTWQAWRDDPSHCDRLVFISVEKHPVSRCDLARVHGVQRKRAGAETPCDGLVPDLRARLVDAWPVLTPGWHDIDLGEPGGAVRLMLGLGDVADLLPCLLAQVDAFYLDGFSPAKNPDMWADSLLSRLGRLAAPGATAATWTYARAVRDGLQKAGFVTERGPGLGSKRDMLSARFEPRHVPPPPAGGLWPELPLVQRQALVLGAGLAGCSAAQALRQAGWGVHLMDRAEGPAMGASGNPGGLFHSIVHGEDGVHARAHRAAALATHRALQPLWASGLVSGQGTGLLRLDAKTTAGDARSRLTHLGLTEDHVTWLDPLQAAELAGLPVPSGGWLFHQAGWVHPAAWAQAMLKSAADGLPPSSSASLRCSWGAHVARVQRRATPRGLLWQALDAQGQVLGEAPVLVLANAAEASSLLIDLPADQAVALPPMSQVRGQITRVPPDQLCSAQALPCLPVAGSGYVLPLQDGSLLCGATTHHHDMAPDVRMADHARNLSQAERLGVSWSPRPDADPAAGEVLGRVGWRATTPDRLPLVGALPWSRERMARAPGRIRLDQVRQLPRERDAHGGIYILSGLGSRGITWAALAGRLLAHWVTGSPCPVEVDLRDAMDPARFLARDAARPGKAVRAPVPAVASHGESG